MKKNNMLKKLSAIVLTGLTLVALSACGNTKEAKKEKDGTETLRVYTQSATFEGKVDGWTGKIYKDALNLKLEVTPNSVGGTSRFETKLASGDIGDVILFTSGEDFQKAIDAGAVIDLSDHLKDMPNVEKFPAGIERMNKNYEAVYGIPSMISKEAEINTVDPATAVSMRYDYYSELGHPQIKEYWNYFDVAKDMVAAHPQTEDGNNFYGLSLFSEWDGTSASLARQISTNYGYVTGDGINKYDFVNAHAVEDKTEELLAEDGLYIKALEFFNKFYQADLLDEDSISQTWEDYLAKAEKGQSAMWIYGYMGDLNFNPANQELVKSGKGYKRIPFDNMKISDAKTSTVGNNWFWAVGSKAKNVDKAIEFIDYIYSEEGAVSSELALEGLFYEMKDGQPVLTELGQANIDAEVPAEFGGGVVGDTFKKMINGPTIDNKSSFDLLGGESANKTTWKSYLEENAKQLDKDWSAHFSKLSAKDYIIEHNLLAPYDTVDVPILDYDDELAVKRDQVGQVIKEQSWKMIYAKDDATFDSLKAEMIKKAESLGYKECVALEETAAQAWFEARK